ncbi:hypothetical protein F2P79_020412 [Pimephales promelas]|nr:hypothetical protein F2P79_020412 [Pimephales promelas]
MVLIHQGAVRVEPEPVTAIQEEGQRLTAGHRPPLASGTTRIRPLMDHGPRHQAIGGATTPAQTPDSPVHTSSPREWTFVKLWTTETWQLSAHRFICSTPAVFCWLAPGAMREKSKAQTKDKCKNPGPGMARAPHTNPKPLEQQEWAEQKPPCKRASGPLLFPPSCLPCHALLARLHYPWQPNRAKGTLL